MLSENLPLRIESLHLAVLRKAFWESKRRFSGQIARYSRRYTLYARLAQLLLLASQKQATNILLSAKF